MWKLATGSGRSVSGSRVFRSDGAMSSGLSRDVRISIVDIVRVRVPPGKPPAAAGSIVNPLLISSRARAPRSRADPAPGAPFTEPLRAFTESKWRPGPAPPYVAAIPDLEHV